MTKPDSTEIEIGRKQFNSNCSVFHSVKPLTVVGPTLNDIEKRHSKKWIIKYIKNDNDFKRKNKEVQAIWEKQIYTDHINFDILLTDRQLNSILVFIRIQSKTINAEKK